MKLRPRRGLAGWIACIVALGIWAGPSEALGQEDARDEVLRLLASQPLRADLVVLLDTSGSMAKHFDEARRFVGDLSELARPDDTITFIAFAGKATELMPPVTVREGGAQALRARLARLHPPSAPHTDLSAGLDATLDALLRPGYAPLSMVFLITDFCAELPPGSRHAGPVEGTGPCRQLVVPEPLKRKSARLFGTGDQSVRSFALALEPTSESGLAGARAVLGPLVRVDVTAGDLAAALGNVRPRIEYERAGLAIEQMLRHPPLSLEWPSVELPLRGARELELTVVSSSPLPMNVHVRGLRAPDGSLRFELGGSGTAFELLPRAKAPLVVRVERTPGAGTETKTDPRGVSPTSVSREVALVLELDLALSPREPLEKLIGAEPRARTVVRQKLALRFATATAHSWYERIPRSPALAAAFALALAFAAYLRAAKQRVLPATLAGRLVVHGGPKDLRRVAISLRGRTRLMLEGAATSTLEIRLDGDRVILPGLVGTTAELYAEKVGRRSVMRLRKLAGDAVEVSTQPLGAMPVAVRKGYARFSVGGYRCVIE